MEINIGTLIYETFNLIIGFFTKLYSLISVRFEFPSFVINFIQPILQSINPDISMPTEISLLGLIAASGVPVALAISIYYIFKSPV